jgi:hypothetical protein
MLCWNLLKKTLKDTPPLGTLVFCIINFVIVQIVGFDPKDAKPRDIVVGVTLSGFYIRQQYGY